MRLPLLWGIGPRRKKALACLLLSLCSLLGREAGLASPLECRPLPLLSPLLQAHKASLQRKLAERQADVAAQAAELAGVERENEALRTRVAAQTVHPQDVMRMNQDK